MSILQETQSILDAYKILPKKRLGQNFIVDEDLLHKMISYAEISRDEVILEVGAGLGFLAKLLSQRCRQVIAVEVDPKLAGLLRERLSRVENVTIMQGDILMLPIPPFDKLVSTPPYSISSPLLFWLLNRNFECAVLTFQTEFAERLVAQPNSKEYSRLTVATYYRAEVDLLDHVPRWAFWPPPKVGSRIIRLRPKKPPFQLKDEKIFFEILRVLFTQKNRKVKNAIKPFLDGLKLSEKDADEWLKKLPFTNKRARELPPEDFGLMANEIVERLHEKGLL